MSGEFDHKRLVMIFEQTVIPIEDDNLKLGLALLGRGIYINTVQRCLYS